MSLILMHVKSNSVLSAFWMSYFFSKVFISSIESLNVTWWERRASRWNNIPFLNWRLWCIQKLSHVNC